MKSKKNILLVDDDQIDVMTVKRAFKELNMTNPLNVASNGEEALDYLRNPDNPRPSIILLDLNMPKMDGIEFLRVIKNDDDLRVIPVIMLTTSKEQQDKVDSFKLGVAGYMTKPVDHIQFVEKMRAINMYWTLSETV